MADNNNLSYRRINKKLDGLSSSVDSIYNSVYSTRVDNRNDMDRITRDIDTNLDDLLSSINNQDMSSISTLITRINKKNGVSTDSLNKELESLVSDNTVIDSINLENVEKFIQAENYQYDLILKYVPKLAQALEIMKDNVLSSDNFTKDFVNVTANKSSEEDITLFSHRAKRIIDKYNIQDLFEDMHKTAQKYGEYFLYQVPYKVAFKRLMDRKQAPVTMQENSKLYSGNQTIIFESKSFKGIMDDNNENKLSKEFMSTLNENEGKVILRIDPYNIIPEAISEVKSAFDAKSKYESLSEAYLHEDSEQGTDNNWSRGTLTYDSTMAISHDGMYNRLGDKGPKDDSDHIKDMAGCVMYEIPRENIIPLYIGDFCIGYYYFNVVNNYVSRQVVMGNTFNSITSSSRIKDEDLDRQTDMLVAHIAAELSDQIDSRFINQNVDLRQEIFAILRFNDNFNASMGTNTINVTFIPAEDVHHFYFSLDKHSHRGISDLQNSIVPAMLYALLYLTDIINKVSRSQDKRIYYVKQNVETNVARTMLNVISQLKKGNMGMRQLENMNTIFNVIGKYNDHIIPKSPSGDAPIEFEVMPGQQSETPSELMDRMEESAVNNTDVPYEFVQSINQVDFATRFTMSNSKFLRKVFKRQYICQKHFSEIFQKLYNYEFNENETGIKVNLPAPAFLTMTNFNQLFDNTKTLAQSIADFEIIDNEELKPEFIKIFIHDQLGTYLDFDKIQRQIEQAKHNLNLNATKNMDVSDEPMGDDDEY